MVAPIFSISEPPYPLKTWLHGRMVINWKGEVLEVCGSNYTGIRSGIDFQAHVVVFVNLDLGVDLSGWLSRACTEIS